MNLRVVAIFVLLAVVSFYLGAFAAIVAENAGWNIWAVVVILVATVGVLNIAAWYFFEDWVNDE